MNELIVRPISENEHGLFRAMYSNYIHDLSEFTDFYQMDASGKWCPDYLSTWLDLDRSDIRVLLFWAHQTPIGFALIGVKPFPYMSADIDYQMSEFFIARGYRRAGYGRSAAEQIFKEFQGDWETIQLPENRGASIFWLNIIGNFTSGKFESDILSNGEIRQRFNVKV